MASLQDGATSIVASFTTAVSKATNTYSFAWGKPIITGTEQELIPTSYVICYSLSSELPTQVSTIGPVYEQYGMELLAEVPGKLANYQISTTNLDFYKDAVWAIYPLFDTGTTGVIAGALVFAKTYAASDGLDRSLLRDPRMITIDDDNNMYFIEDGFLDSTNTSYNKLIGKVTNSKSLSHINGDTNLIDNNTTYENIISVNSSTNKLLRMSESGGDKITIYNLSNNTVDYSFKLDRLTSIVDSFIWNNKFYIRAAQGSVSEVNASITGIFEVDPSLNPSASGIGPAGGGTESAMGTFTQEEGTRTFYERTFSHPTAFANIVEGQVFEQLNNPGFVKEKVNSTTIKVITTSSSAWTDSSLFKIYFFPVKLYIGRLLGWGVPAGGTPTGTTTQSVNTQWWNTVIDTNNVTYTKGFVYLDDYNIAMPAAFGSVDLASRTFAAGTSHSLLYVRRTLRAGNEIGVGSFSQYALSSNGTSGNSTILYKFVDGSWTSFATVGSAEYLRDIVWSSKDNCFYATYKNLTNSFSPVYDIKRITVNGVVEDINDSISDGTGEEKDTAEDDFGLDFGGGTGGSGGGVTVKPPEDEGDIEVTIDDPEDPTLPGPYVTGVSPDDVFSLRKNRDILYILRNGIIIWTYKLTPRQLYNMTSNKYIGWVNRVTGEPIETPEDAVYFNLDYSFDYIFNGTIEEPMASTDILFTYGKHYQGQSLVVWDDGQIKIDRFTLEEDLKTADYYVPGGRVFTLPNGQKAKSPLIPYWVLNIIVENNAQQYLVKVEDL